ncbi:MAG: CHAT domain-containing protein [Candidatus Omnitrophica bacterium]|nr:CHAT domain-containing protein [Candidatus Omnitrophota bacterium]
MPCADPLVLEVFKYKNSLKSCLFRQGSLSPTLRRYSQVGVSFSELRYLALETVGILNRPYDEGAGGVHRLKSLQETGKLLWDYLFSRSIKERLKESPSCILTLSLDAELIYLPWELVFDGADFLSLKFGMGRVVRSRGDSFLLPYRNPAQNARMLILADPTGDLKSAYREGVIIKKQVSLRNKSRVQADFKSTNIDRYYARNNICNYDIVHFAGHGDHGGPGGGGWIFKDGSFGPGDIFKMRQGCNFPALVFSNACHTAESVLARVRFDYQRDSYGMAGAFLSAGVRHYIGAIRKVEDNAALVFAREFYRGMVSGKEMGESLRLARVKLKEEYGLRRMYWVNYLLYGDPGFIFFKPLRQQKHVSEIGKTGGNKSSRRLGAIFICLSAVLVFGIPKNSTEEIMLYSNALNYYRRGDNRQALIFAQRLMRHNADFLDGYPLIADSYRYLGDQDNALKYYIYYLFESRKMGSQAHLLRSYIKLGWFLQVNGSSENARKFYDKALELSKSTNDKKNEALVLRKLAAWHADRARYEEALDLLARSIAINIEYHADPEDSENLARDCFAIGTLLMKKGDYETAGIFYERSRKIFESLMLNNDLRDCYYNLGKIYRSRGLYSRSLGYYFKGLRIDIKNGYLANLAGGYIMVAGVYADMGDLNNMERYLKKSIVLSKKTNNLMDLSGASYRLGLLYKKEGRDDLSEKYLSRAQEIYRLTTPDECRGIRKRACEIKVPGD